MQYECFAASLPQADKDIVCGNYFLNGICNDNTEESEIAISNLSRSSSNMYAVSDSSSSEVRGDEAAYISVEVLRDFFASDFDYSYMDYFDTTNGILKTKMFENAGKQLKTEVAVLCIDRKRAVTYTVGGIAVLLLRSGKLTRLNDGVIETVDALNVTEADNGKAQGETVTVAAAKFLGVDTEEVAVCPFVSERKRLRRGDTVIICPESLVNALGIASFKKAVSEAPPNTNPAEQLIRTAREKGIKTDMTVEIIKPRRGIGINAPLVRKGIVSALVAAALFVGIAFGDDVWRIAKGFALGNMLTFEKREDSRDEWKPISAPEGDNTAENSTAPAEAPTVPAPEAQSVQPAESEVQAAPADSPNPVRQNPIHAQNPSSSKPSKNNSGQQSSQPNQTAQPPASVQAQPAANSGAAAAQPSVAQPAQPAAPSASSNSGSVGQPELSGNELPMDN